MKIGGIFIQPRIEDVSVRATFLEPLGLERILAIAKNEGHEVELFILEPEKPWVALEKIKKYSPDVLAFSLMTCEVNNALALVSTIKSGGIRPLLIAGGPHSTADPEYLLKHGFDICVMGEGEVTFREILNRKDDLDRIKGIVFKRGRTIIHNFGRERIKDLDSLPHPLRFEEFIRLKDLGMFPSHLRQKGVASVDYSRGCWFDCFFCESPRMWGQKVYHRSARDVVREVEDLQSKEVNLIFFVDLNFTAKRNKVLELCKAIKETGIRWKCQANINTSGHKDMLVAMKEAGCTSIYWGVESLNPLIRSRLRKLSKDKGGEEVLRLSASVGIINHGFYMIGFPWETKEDIRRYFDILPELELHRLRVTIATPLPNTDWYKTMDKREIVRGYLNKADTNHLVYKHPHFTERDLKEFQLRLLQSFFLSKRYKERVKKVTRADPSLEESFVEYFRMLPFKVEI